MLVSEPRPPGCRAEGRALRRAARDQGGRSPGFHRKIEPGKFCEAQGNPVGTILKGGGGSVSRIYPSADPENSELTNSEWSTLREHASA